MAMLSVAAGQLCVLLAAQGFRIILSGWTALQLLQKNI